MPWTLNVGVLDAGATATYWYAWEGYPYQGRQFVQAVPGGVWFTERGEHPVLEYRPAWLEVLSYGVDLDNKPQVFEAYSYSVTVRNNGPHRTQVLLHGGGV